MLHHFADDGRIMTPPKELEPLLKGSFSAFSKLIGHIRFFYLADEIWDGKTMLVFNADRERLAAVTLDDSVFDVQIADKGFRVSDEALLGVVFEALRKAVPLGRHRPIEQRTMNMDDPDKFPCGYRSDMCLLNKKQNEKDFSACNRFGYLDWLCYRDCVPNTDIKRPPQQPC